MAQPMTPAFCPRCGNAAAAGLRSCSTCGLDLAADPAQDPGAAGTPSAGAPSEGPEPIPGPISAISAINGPALALLVAAGIAAAGAFLPWLTGSASISRNGMDGGGDGPIVLCAAAIVAVAGLARALRLGSLIMSRLLGIIGAAGLLYIAWVNIGTIDEPIPTGAATGHAIVAGVGFGLFIIGLAGAIALICSLLTVPADRRR